MIKIKLIWILIFLLICNYTYSQTPQDVLKDKLFIKSLEDIGDKKWKLALIKLQELQKNYPKNFIILNNLALVNFYVDDYTKSKNLFEDAINNDKVCSIIYGNINKIKQYKTSSFYREITKSNELLNQPQLDILKSNSIIYKTILSTIYVNSLNSNGNIAEIKVAYELDRAKNQKRIDLLQNRIKELTEQVQSINKNRKKTTVSAVALKKGTSKKINTNKIKTLNLNRKQNKKTEEQIQIQTQIQQKMKEWKNAWSSGKISQYLNFYAPNFKPIGKKTLKKWLVERKARIYPARKIKINNTITNIKVGTNSKIKSVVVNFIQKYESISFKSTGRKTILWQQQENGDWKIVREYNRQ